MLVSAGGALGAPGPRWSARHYLDGQRPQRVARPSKAGPPFRPALEGRTTIPRRTLDRQRPHQLREPLAGLLERPLHGPLRPADAAGDLRHLVAFEPQLDRRPLLGRPLV